MSMKYRSLAAFAALLACLSAAAQDAPRVSGEPALTPKAAGTPHLKLSERDAVVEVRLAPVTEAEVQAVRTRNATRPSRQIQRQRLAVGIARPAAMAPVPARSLAWKAVEGGAAARVAVTSPEAGSLRVALELAGVPPDVELAFFGSHEPSRIEGPVRVGEIADRTAKWWSPLTEGETQTVEIFVPARHSVRDVPLTVVGASHLFTTASSGFAKRIQDIGDAGSCNVDIACSALASDPAFRNAANSVAQMVFNDAGFTVVCSGTLLADGDGNTQVPWFYSANHCFENEDPPYKSAAQMQAVANTLSTLWGFEANACGSSTPRSSWSQLNGGATFLHNSVASDVLFMRLNGTPPGTAFYSGWDANPLSAGSALVGLHHPQGDLKKVSQGTVLRMSSPNVTGLTGSYAEARWSSGTTEVGSSGSGIWTASGGQYYFRGGLWGGTAACSTTLGTDFYSRFDQAYPVLSQYLGSFFAPAFDYTDMWWNPNENGWGLNLTQHPTRVIFGVWYTYEVDDTPVWYILPSGSWTSTNRYTGPLYVTSGPPFSGPFDASRVETRQVGTATLTFSGANDGTFAYTVDGVSGTKSITRLGY
jgi:lysyl endopeptidase